MSRNWIVSTVYKVGRGKLRHVQYLAVGENSGDAVDNLRRIYSIDDVVTVVPARGKAYRLDAEEK